MSASPEFFAQRAATLRRSEHETRIRAEGYRAQGDHEGASRAIRVAELMAAHARELERWSREEPA